LERSIREMFQGFQNLRWGRTGTSLHDTVLAAKCIPLVQQVTGALSAQHQQSA